jgi:soluble lytic murein transglycosylase
MMASGERFVNQFKTKIMMIILALVTASPAFAKGKLSSEQRKRRLDHARELLGRGYKKSVVSSGEKLAKINSKIYRWTKDSLPASYKSNSRQIAQAIIDQAFKNNMDPVFVMAVIQTESSFIPSKIGGVGEIGLMQIRPETAKWIVEKMSLNVKDMNLRDPLVNIQIGTAYLAYLRERFDDHARLYVSAYNMGPSNVKELRRKSQWPKEYPARVMSHYVNYYSELRERQNRETASTGKTAKNG